MKKRIAFITVGGLLIIGLILGSFFDFAINQALFSDRNPFGIIVASLGLLPGYGLIAFSGGSLLEVTYRSKQPVWLKAILYFLSFGGLGCAVYFSQADFFSVNGFNISGTGITILGYIIALVIHFGISVIGFFLSKYLKNEKAWIAILILSAALIIAMVPGVQVLKSLMHRPRYRTIQLGIPGIDFHNWWEPFTGYKSFITDEITKEEFKSFPSGHAATSMLVPFFLMLLSYYVPKLKGKESLLFSLGFAYFLMVCFTRLLVGAHFLSDICIGGLLTFVFLTSAYAVVWKLKLLENNDA